MNNRRFNVAVVSATGAVGEQSTAHLEKRESVASEMNLLSSARSAGTIINFKGDNITVEEATPESFEGIDIALFSTGGDMSQELAPTPYGMGLFALTTPMLSDCTRISRIVKT